MRRRQRKRSAKQFRPADSIILLARVHVRTPAQRRISRVENQRGRLLAGAHSRCLLLASHRVGGSIVAPIVESLLGAAAAAADVINLVGDTVGVAKREIGRVCERGHLFHLRVVRPGPSGCRGRRGSSQAAGVPPRVGRCSSGSAAPGSIQITLPRGAPLSGAQSANLTKVEKHPGEYFLYVCLRIHTLFVALGWISLLN